MIGTLGHHGKIKHVHAWKLCHCPSPLICLKLVLLSFQAKEINDKVCRENPVPFRVSIDSKVIPFKTRCGVSSLSNITLESRCSCSEKNDKGVGKPSSPFLASRKKNLIWIFRRLCHLERGRARDLQVDEQLFRASNGGTSLSPARASVRGQSSDIWLQPRAKSR